MNREDWLNAAAIALFDDFLKPEKALYALPKYRISIGYPKGQRKSKSLAQCLDPSLSTDGTTEIFVSPESDDEVAILSALTVALMRAGYGFITGTPLKLNSYMQRAYFERNSGKGEDYLPTGEARDLFADIAAELGPIPHAKVNPNQKKQSTRLLKVECTIPNCGAVWRMSAKWAHQCIVCPCCGDLNTPPTIHV